MQVHMQMTNNRGRVCARTKKEEATKSNNLFLLGLSVPPVSVNKNKR